MASLRGRGSKLRTQVQASCFRKAASVLDLAGTGAKSASVDEMKKLLDEMRAEED